MTAIGQVGIFPYGTGDGAYALSISGGGTLDAANEYVDMVGQMYWEGAPASKTVSSAGGAVIWVPNSVSAFADAGTTLRIGVQDLDSATGPPGRGDGTFDCSLDLVGGTDTITSGAEREDAIETGTETISHGAFIAVRFLFVSRGGTDDLRVRQGTLSATTSVLPGVTENTGTPTAVARIPMVALKADDGTIGWLAGAAYFVNATTTTYNVDSATDEYATLVSFPFAWSCGGIVAAPGALTSTDDFEVILYSDPLGTPVAERTTTIDVTQTNIGNNSFTSPMMFSSAYAVAAGTTVGLALRPTTTDSISITGLLYGTSSAAKKTLAAMGGTWQEGSRAGQSGAFTASTTRVLNVGPMIIDITFGGSGGAPKQAGRGGGLAG